MDGHIRCGSSIRHHSSIDPEGEIIIEWSYTVYPRRPLSAVCQIIVSHRIIVMSRDDQIRQTYVDMLDQMLCRDIHLRDIPGMGRLSDGRGIYGTHPMRHVRGCRMLDANIDDVIVSESIRSIRSMSDGPLRITSTIPTEYVLDGAISRRVRCYHDGSVEGLDTIQLRPRIRPVPSRDHPAWGSTQDQTIYVIDPVAGTVLMDVASDIILGACRAVASGRGSRPARSITVLDRRGPSCQESYT